MFKKELDGLKEKSLLRKLRTVESVRGTRAVVDGREYTLFCTNDYLGLSSHPAVCAAAKDAIDDAGFGSGSAPLIAGRSAYHEKLEQEIASFKRAETALLFGSGYLANTGLIPALASQGDVILSDSLNHASIVDGCRLSRAEVRVYRHTDVSSLEDKLKEPSGFNRRWIVTEGVFSMDGDIAPMPEITALAEKYGATVIIDDAHATGAIGSGGRGTLEHFGLPADNVVQMGTLGKAVGSYGAFVAGPRDVAGWLVNSARSFMFSTALPIPVCAAASAALGVIKGNPERRARMARNAEKLRGSLAAMGLTVLGDGTPIIPVLAGEAMTAVGMSATLMEKGFLAPAIRPPTVPEGESRIRFTVSALHTAEDIDALTDALRGMVTA